MSARPMHIVETDEAGNVTADYVYSPANGSHAASRVDAMKSSSPKTTIQRLVDVFLPAGYPHSVTDDYLEYQIYDSLQAFASSIAGLLSSRAVLEGVGVGDANASTTAAVLLSILQESLGRVTTILFAYRLGTSLEPECKMYRLLADIFNDAAMILECLSPAFPKPIRVSILATSSALKALCGVAAGSSKASLSAHFARWGNLGELNAKDSSQETVISLIGMLAGSAVVSYITSPTATWSTLILLLSMHLALNYKAVRAVRMTSLNRQRASIVFAEMIEHDKVLSPAAVAEKEWLFEQSGAIRNAEASKVLGHCRIGVSWKEFCQQVRCTNDSSLSTAGGSVGSESDVVATLLEISARAKANYVLWFDSAPRQATILLKKNCSVRDQLKAWYACQMVLSGRAIDTEAKEKDPTARHNGTNIAKGRMLKTIEDTQIKIEMTFEDDVTHRLLQAGWDLDTAALETHSGYRILVE